MLEMLDFAFYIYQQYTNFLYFDLSEHCLQIIYFTIYNKYSTKGEHPENKIK